MADEDEPNTKTVTLEELSENLPAILAELRDKGTRFKITEDEKWKYTIRPVPPDDFDPVTEDDPRVTCASTN